MRIDRCLFKILGVETGSVGQGRPIPLRPRDFYIRNPLVSSIQPAVHADVVLSLGTIYVVDPVLSGIHSRSPASAEIIK